MHLTTLIKNTLRSQSNWELFIILRNLLMQQFLYSGVTICMLRLFSALLCEAGRLGWKCLINYKNWHQKKSHVDSHSLSLTFTYSPSPCRLPVCPPGPSVAAPWQRSRWGCCNRALPSAPRRVGAWSCSHRHTSRTGPASGGAWVMCSPTETKHNQGGDSLN